MTRLLRHEPVNTPGYDPTRARPVRLVARDLDPDMKLPAHTHRWHQVLYTTIGSLSVSTGDVTYFVPPSRAIWIAAGIRHAVATAEHARMRSLYVLPTAVASRGRALPTDACRVLEVSPLLRELIADLGTDATELEPERERTVSTLILSELARAETLHVGVRMPTDVRLVKLCRALIDEPASTRTLGEWAPHVGASARTLSRLFRDELDTTFAEWRQRMRLAHAAPLLARGLPLSRVASELGYASQSAFSAMFRRTFGKSPSAFFAAGPHA